MLKDLTDHRRLASIASGGTSDEPVYAAFLRLILTYDLGGAVLDYGAGAGVLTERLLSLGRFTSITGVDLMTRPTGMPQDVNWVSCDINEHLENPRAVIREWFRLLKSGGTLALSTPNNESWRALIALIFRGHFVSF